MRSRWFKNGPIFMAFEFETIGLKGGGMYPADLLAPFGKREVVRGVSIREVAQIFEYHRKRDSNMP